MNGSAASLIRQAISREDYPGALELWNAYASDLKEALDRGELEHGEMRQARELFEWSSLALQGARAHLQAQLGMACGAAAYLPRHTPNVLIEKSL
jgi:hypothetical protein